MSVTVADIGVEVPTEWVEAVNTRLNELHHEDLCACEDWPVSCANGYLPGQWDEPTTAMVAVAVLEPLIREQITAQDASAATPSQAPDAGKDAEDDEVISTAQVADILGVSRPTVVRFLNQGRIPYTQPGVHRRVRRADAYAYRDLITRDARART